MMTQDTTRKEITRNEAGYPRRLLTGLDGCDPGAPDTIYVLGDLPADDVKTVLITGARICSEYGRYTARIYGQQMAEQGYQIITDMSLGVSGIAANAAIKSGGKVFAVAGCGADICYPPENRAVYDAIKSTGGGIISEMFWGIHPERQFFDTRRRLLAALADVVVLIEARRKSGTLVTVEIAAKIGKPVFCVPGRCTDRLSDGTNEMIKTGAAMLTMTPEDIPVRF